MRGLDGDPRVVSVRQKPSSVWTRESREASSTSSSADAESSGEGRSLVSAEPSVHWLRLIITGKFVLDSNSTFKVYWDWMVMVATFYVGVVTPYNAAFNSPQGENPEVKIGGIIMDILFVIDVLIKFRTTYYDESGREVRDPGRIANNYLLGWFWIDLVAGFPYDILEAFVERDTLETVLLVKCVRVLRLARLFTVLERYSQYSSVILAINMVTYVLFAHWFACIWYVIGRNEYNGGNDKWNIGWLYRLDRMSHPLNYDKNKPESGILTPQQRYWSAMYFSLTLITTVGFGNEAANSVSEKISVCVAMPIFALMHAVVFGNVTAIIQRMYARRFAYDILYTEMEDFCKIYAMPRSLKRKMFSFTRTMWTANRGISYHKLIGEFPDEMRAEIYCYIFEKFLSAKLFSGAPVGCRKAIALQMRDNFLTTKETLLTTGDTIRSIYFIAAGSVTITRHGRTVSTLGVGEIFGPHLDQCRYFTAKSDYDVVMTSTTKLHCLSIAGLSYALSLYPDFQALIPDRLASQLAFNLCDRKHAEPDPSLGMIPFISFNNGRISSPNQTQPHLASKLENMSVALELGSRGAEVGGSSAASAKAAFQELQEGMAELGSQLTHMLQHVSALEARGPVPQSMALKRELTFYDHINMHF